MARGPDNILHNLRTATGIKCRGGLPEHHGREGFLSRPPGPLPACLPDEPFWTIMSTDSRSHTSERLHFPCHCRPIPRARTQSLSQSVTTTPAQPESSWSSGDADNWALHPDLPLGNRRGQIERPDGSIDLESVRDGAIEGIDSVQEHNKDEPPFQGLPFDFLLLPRHLVTRSRRTRCRIGWIGTSPRTSPPQAPRQPHLATPALPARVVWVAPRHP